MTFLVHAESPPLREDPDGALRVGRSRVLLELVIRAFQDGATPEAIVQKYPSLDLSDTYTVIGYFLRHQEEIEAYLKQRERLAQDVQGRIAARQGDLSTIRARLAAHRPD